MLEKTNYENFFKAGMRICLVVQELVNEKPRLVSHGTQGDTVFVGYTFLGNATFMVVDKSEGTGRKTQISETLAVNTHHIVYATQFKGPPKV